LSIDDLIVLMRTVELDLSAHDRTHRGAARHAVHGFGKVELGLDLPQLIMLARCEELGWITSGDLTDGDDRLRRELGVTWSTLLIRSDLLPATELGNSDAAVAMKTSSSIVAPLTWVCGPMSTALAADTGCLARPHTSAFSMIRTSSPIQISPSSAVSTAPCSTRARSPRVTPPHSTAEGAP
jgi:hypothetical protein